MPFKFMPLLISIIHELFCHTNYNLSITMKSEKIISINGVINFRTDVDCRSFSLGGAVLIFRNENFVTTIISFSNNCPIEIKIQINKN